MVKQLSVGFVLLCAFVSLCQFLVLPSPQIDWFQIVACFCYHPRHMEEMEKEVKKDRKSTRLNSSHSQISYAVFCLKKKKKKDKKIHIKSDKVIEMMRHAVSRSLCMV